MDANHQDKVGSRSILTEEVKWVRHKNNQLWLPKYNKPTGFENKTRWDKLQFYAQVIGAIAIPLSIIALIVSVWQFNAQQKYDSQKTEEQTLAQFQSQKDQQEQSTLDTYLDRMSDLLLNGNLGSPQASVEVRALARARTLTALRILDPVRKGILLEFLHESDLIGYETYVITNGKTLPTLNKPILNLIGADLSYIGLPSGTDLSGSDLAGTDLENATLYDVNLDEADLLFAYLYGANLTRASLYQATLKYMTLDKAVLFNAFLEDANVSSSSLEGTNLSHANLRDANLFYSDLSNANLSYSFLNNADLTGVDLSYTNLTGAFGLTPEQLSKARSLKGTIMPDGSVHP